MGREGEEYQEQDTQQPMNGPTINIMRWDARERATRRNATVYVARGRTRLEGTK